MQRLLSKCTSTNLVEFFGLFVEGGEEGEIFFGLLRLELVQISLRLRHSICKRV